MTTKRTAPAQRSAKPAAKQTVASGRLQRPRPKDSRHRITPAVGQKQVTAADIPGTSDHARRTMRESAAHNRDAREVAQAGTRGIRVEAIKDGYYGHSRRREGDVFTIRDEKELGSWMRKVGSSTRESITTPNEVIRKKHDETLALKYGDRVAGGQSPDDPAFDDQADDENPLNAD